MVDDSMSSVYPQSTLLNAMPVHSFEIRSSYTYAACVVQRQGVQCIAEQPPHVGLPQKFTIFNYVGALEITPSNELVNIESFPTYELTSKIREARKKSRMGIGNNADEIYHFY